jgi:hypothetical protein
VNLDTCPRFAYARLMHNLHMPIAQLAHDACDGCAAQLLTQVLTHNLHAARRRFRAGADQAAYARAVAQLARSQKVLTHPTTEL